MPGEIWTDADRLKIRQYHPRLKPTPIPAERWNEGEQRCLSINAKWAAHIIGLLSMLEQPDTWIGTVEECEDATIQATEIIAALGMGLCPDPCPECPDCPEPTECPVPIPGVDNGGFFFPGFGPCNQESECECMSNGPCAPIKIENGKLWWWSCCQWQEIGALNSSATQTEPPDDIWEPEDPNEPSPTYSACGKARAALELIYDVAHAVWDYKFSLPWKQKGLIQDRVPGVQLDNEYLASAIVNAIGADALFSESAVFDADIKQSILCRAVKLFNDTSAGVTDAVWDGFKNIFYTEWDTARRWFYVACMEAIGKGDLNTVVKLGATDATADCGCPEPPPTPSGKLYFAGLTDDYTNYDEKDIVFGANYQSMTFTLQKAAGIGSYAGARLTILLACTAPVTSFDLMMTGTGRPSIDWQTDHTIFGTMPGQHKCALQSFSGFARTLVAYGTDFSRWHFEAASPTLFPTIHQHGQESEWRPIPHNAPALTEWTVTLALENVT